jgi:predicted nucleic acid-binding protein
MNYLLDTNVVSELRKVKTGKIDRRVAAWEKTISATQMYLSAVSVFELEIGILLIERRDAAQGSMLRRWMDELVLPAFEGRILPIDLETTRRCAPLHVPDPKPERDAWIAATALLHGMTVVTRNVKHFEPMGVTVLNPWEA